MRRRARYWGWCLAGDTIVFAGWPHEHLVFYIAWCFVIALVASFLTEG